MQLLVSVRSPEEVEAARAGGADIIDAKDPARGPLGAVSPAVLTGILEQVPTDQPFSVALGDLASSGQVVATLTGLQFPSRSGPTFLKLGFAGILSTELVETLLTSSVRLTSAWRMPPRIVAVAYADAARAGSLSVESITRLAGKSGAAGVLIDTYVKDGSRLLDWCSPLALADSILSAREMNLLTGVAGALGIDDIAAAALGAPDVIGFRGAACDGGRLGKVSARKVCQLRQRLDGSPQVPPAVQPIAPRGTAKSITRQ